MGCCTTIGARHELRKTDLKIDANKCAGVSNSVGYTSGLRTPVAATAAIDRVLHPSEMNTLQATPMSLRVKAVKNDGPACFEVEDVGLFGGRGYSNSAPHWLSFAGRGE